MSSRPGGWLTRNLREDRPGWLLGACAFGLALVLMAGLTPVWAAFSATTTNAANAFTAAATFPTYSAKVSGDTPWAYYRGEESGSSAATLAATDSTANARAGKYNGITNGPTTTWNFDENTGSTAADASGTANTGTLANSPTWTTGKVGYAVNLNGTNQYVTGARAAVDTSRAFTVAAWVYLTDNTLGRVAVSQSGSISSGFILRYNRWAGTGRWDFMASQGNSFSPVFDYSNSASSSAALNTWTHLVGVYDGAGNITLYVNGVAQTSAAHTPAWNATGALRVGRVWEWGGYQDATDGWADWAGKVDDVRVFQRALSANEISSLANGLPSTDWELSEGASTTVADRGAAGITGTATSTTWTTGHDGNGLSFNGSSSYVAGSGAAVTTNSAFSVAAWVNLAAKTQNRTAVSQDGATVSGFYLQYDSGSDRWAFTVRSSDADAATGYQALGTSSPSLSTWYHLVGVYDSGAGQLKLYVNGALQATTAFASPWNATGAVMVGRARFSASPVDYFQGAIDGVKLYQRALSASEAADLYNGVAYTEPDMTAGVTGALQGAQQGQQSTTAVAFAGLGNAYTGTIQGNPTNFTIECWFRSASSTGGLLIGFADTQTGKANSRDRHVYLDSGGKLTFGVFTGSATTIRSTNTYNDGAWHHMAASLGAAGMQLYVDGALVASGANTTAQNYNGYWRWGGASSLSNWPNGPTTGNLTGTIDEVALFTSQLSDQQIAWHYHANH